VAIDDILKRPQPVSYVEKALDTDPEAFFKVIESRRSVRAFEPTPVPEDVVRRCLDAALKAPNSSNLQAWEFHWVRSPEKKRLLAQACLGQPAATTAPELIVFLARTGTWKDMRGRMLEALRSQGDVPKAAMDYYDKLIPLVMTIGPFGLLGLAKKVGLFLRGLSQPTPREPTTSADLRVWAVKSCALACENFMLAARATGYDTCPMEGFDSSRVRKLLQLPSDAVVTMVISMGKRAPGGVYGPRIRFAPELFIKEH
jgi:nitroreductase